MGLDQYASTTKRRLWKGVDFPQLSDDRELFYWRKHPNLHGWMQTLYDAKEGRDVEFNCTTVELTAADLDALEWAITAKRLPHTTGFFFGQSYSNAAERQHDLDFVAKAREAIGQGLRVYYHAWW